MKTKYILLFSTVFMLNYNAFFSQAFDQATVAVTANIGAPHLYKGIIKLATKTEKFKEVFNGKLEVSNVKGVYPMALKGEWGVNKYFGIGLSTSRWNMSFQVKDYYNVLHAGNITGTDEIDTYKFKLTSTSVGIRPNLHIPLKDDKNDLFLGISIGITSNSLNIDFSSTDVNKVLPNAKYDLSLPGFVYFASSIGYRRYFTKNFGCNIELGYEKGAIIQGGIALRFNHKSKA